MRKLSIAHKVKLRFCYGSWKSSVWTNFCFDLKIFSSNIFASIVWWYQVLCAFWIWILKYTGSVFYQADDSRISLPRKSLGHPQKICWLQSWTLYKSVDCRWISITILCVSFTNMATVDRLEQVQLCNRQIDQSADNITGLKCAKECLILKYKYIQNPWFYFMIFTNTPCPRRSEPPKITTNLALCNKSLQTKFPRLHI